MRSFQKSLIVPALVSALAATQAAAQDAKLPKVIPVDFVKDVKPLLEGACVQCHNPEHMGKEGGDYDMSTKAAAFKGGEAYEGEVIKPKNANDSPVYWMTTVHLDDPKDPEAMPPKKPINEQQQQVLFSWIESGAEWPEGVELEVKPRVNYQNVRPILARFGKNTPSDFATLSYWIEQGADWTKVESAGGPADNEELTAKIHAKILSTTKEKAEADMKEYTGTIPKTGVKYDMVAIKGGEFTMGSPDSESARGNDEGPQHKVKISPFWMGKFEVTWDQYDPFMITNVPRNKDGSPQRIAPDAELWDIVSSPTTPYVEMSFGMGMQGGFPAICMTEQAAMKFCQWLSAQTGHYYRLPTEAEWEYACRAGTTTAYSFGDDPSMLADYAVFDPSQTRTGYDKVGTKKPNPWGLYDMHGNLLEWCMDQYSDKTYSTRKGVTENPFVRPTTLYPRVARGGSWYDTADLLRSAARTASHPDWKIQDPQLPKSIWYHTDAQWLGFRLVRPLEVPDVKTLHEIWNQGTRDEEEQPKPKTPKALELETKVKPLIERGGPFSKEERELLMQWIDESL